MKTPLALASAALLAATLAGCGGSDGPDSEYCKDLKAASSQFETITSSDVANFDEAFDQLRKLADKAPDELEDDWATIDKHLAGIEKALDDAGIKLEDFKMIQEGKMPEGVNVAKLQGLATEFQKLSGPESEKANDAITKHAKDVCKVDISGK